MTIDCALEDYRAFVSRGISLEQDDMRERLTLACMGLAGETGEVIDLIKKLLYHKKKIERDDIIEELGDVFWYYVLILNTLNIEMSDVLNANAKKLIARYPERHDVQEDKK